MSIGERERLGQRRIADLEAENARLQERLFPFVELIGINPRALLNMDEDELGNWLHTAKAVMDERDGYKARDKLRGEALNTIVTELVHSQRDCPKRTYKGDCLCLKERHEELAYAALAATPELTNG